MSSSDRRLSDLDFVVFTNSEADYGVTACSEGIGRRVKELADHITRECAACVASGSAYLVGVAPIPNEMSKFFAFRVVDIGEYKGRPHTLGLVGLLVPAGEREWSVADALSAIPRPRPGARDYRPPNVRLSEIPKATGQPFVRLKSWERSRGGALPDAPACFVEPDSIGCTIRLPRQGGDVTGGRRRALGVVALTICIVVGGICAGFYYGRRRSDLPCDDGDRNAEVQQEKDRIRKALAELLPPQHRLLKPTTSPAELRAAVVVLAQMARAQMVSLLQVLRSVEEPEDRQALIGARWRTWVPLSPGHSGAPETDPNQAEVEDALALIERYKTVGKLLDRLRRTPPGNSDFRLGVDELMRGLETVLPEVAAHRVLPA